MWFRTMGGQQFMNSTLPQILTTVGNLANNIGRLAMSSERRETLVLGGDIKYLEKLIHEYGSGATVGDAAVKEMARLKNQAAENLERQATQINDSFDRVEEMLSGKKPTQDE